MTTIAVLGATGRTGRIVVEQALARGYHVTAVTRRAGSFAPAPRLTVVTADPTVPGSLSGLLDGHDAVISALGTTGRGPTDIYSTGTAEIIAAMSSAGRLLVISSAGLDIPADAGVGARVFTRVLHRIMWHTYADMTRMEQLLAQSDLHWTTCRPTRLTDDPATGSPRISMGAAAKVGPRTPRADLATYLLDAIDDPRTFRTAVAISSR